MASTNIGWTKTVWNPLVGCSRVDEGCEHCYAEVFTARLEAMGQKKYAGLTVVGPNGARWTREVREVPEALPVPLRWKKGRRVFVNSMSDLFHEKVPFEYIAAVFGVMAAAAQHTFQVLTKRPARALEFFQWAEKRGEQGAALFADDPLDWRIRQMCHVMARRRGVDLNADRHQNHGGPWPLPNVHLGVSCANQEIADRQIPFLLKCPADVRWLSLEPLTGPIDLDLGRCEAHDREFVEVDERGEYCNECAADDSSGELSFGHWLDACADVEQPGINWVVVGGESGPDHRQVDPAWVDLIVDQCASAGVAVFVKQDSGPKPGRQGRLSPEAWARKEFPRAAEASQ